MPRRLRVASGGYAYHVLNRAAGRARIFRTPRDFGAFEEVLTQAKQRVPVRLLAWCVMPDHVHVLVTPLHDWSLERILHSWKSFTANEVNRMLHRKGTFWQPESFDHLVRSNEAFESFVAYIEANPVAAGLCSDPSAWQFSSARHRCGVGFQPATS